MGDHGRRGPPRLLSVVVLLTAFAAGVAGAIPIADDPNAASGATTGGGETVTFDVDGWPEGYEGGVWITLELRTDEGVRYYEIVPITLLHSEDDLSGDGLTNAKEVRYGTDFTTPDTIGNGLTD